jgi:hypothetical protein
MKDNGKRVTSAMAVAVLSRELYKHGLERYTSCFIQLSADERANLDDSKLIDLGITSEEDKAKIMGIIRGEIEAPAEAKEKNDELPLPLPERKVASSKSLKQQGNEKYKASNFKEAETLYRAALAFLVSFGGVKVPKTVDILRISLYANVSACKIKLEDWLGAASAADEVLAIDPLHQKALYRRGFARAKLGLLFEAAVDLTQVCIDSCAHRAPFLVHLLSLRLFSYQESIQKINRPPGCWLVSVRALTKRSCKK